MARKAKFADANEILKAMYPDLPDSTDFEEAEGKSKTNDDAAKLAALQSKLDQLEGQLSARNSRHEAPKLAGLPNAPIEPQIDMSKAPDPVQDPQGFIRFSQQAVELKAKYLQDRYQWEQSVIQRQASQMNHLWTDFNEQYENYAIDPDKVEIATDRVIRRAQSAGVELDAYMYNNRDQFYKDITKEMDKLFGAPVAADDGDEGQDEDDDIRTTITGGGNAGQGGVKKVEPQSQYGELSREIQTWQRKTGFYR